MFHIPKLQILNINIFHTMIYIIFSISVYTYFFIQTIGARDNLIFTIPTPIPTENNLSWMLCTLFLCLTTIIIYIYQFLCAIVTDSKIHIIKYIPHVKLIWSLTLTLYFCFYPLIFGNNTVIMMKEIYIQICLTIAFMESCFLVIIFNEMMKCTKYDPEL